MVAMTTCSHAACLDQVVTYERRKSEDSTTPGDCPMDWSVHWLTRDNATPATQSLLDLILQRLRERQSNPYAELSSGESSSVSVLLRRASKRPGRSAKRTLQPRNNLMWMPSRYSRGEGQRRGGSDNQPHSAGHRGRGGGMAVQPRGVNWGPSAFPPEAVSLGAAGPAAKTISGGEGGRGADEAIVS